MQLLVLEMTKADSAFLQFLQQQQDLLPSLCNSCSTGRPLQAGEAGIILALALPLWPHSLKGPRGVPEVSQRSRGVPEVSQGYPEVSQRFRVSQRFPKATQRFPKAIQMYPRGILRREVLSFPL